jgi:long-chain acyl-CoA synthetase
MAHVWEKSYPSAVRWDTPLPPAVPLESLLESAATKWPGRTAVDFYDRAFTYRELQDLATRAAKGLQAVGVGPGVHVGLHLPNTPHFVIGFFAVLMAGGRVVNFSPRAAPRELKYQITDAETQVMITLGLPMLYPQIAALKGTTKFETLVVCSVEDFLPSPIARAFGPAADRVGGGAGREIEFASLIDNDGAFQRHPRSRLEDEVAVLQYTGGTTGEPKGAMLTHANFCAVLNIYNHWDHQTSSQEPGKALAVLPLFHIFGLTFIMLLAVANGEQMVLHIKFDPDRVLADISRKKITVFLGVPTMYTALVNHPKAKEFDLSSVQRWSRAARRCQWKSCNGSKHSAVMLRKRDTASLRSRLWGRFN